MSLVPETLLLAPPRQPKEILSDFKELVSERRIVRYTRGQPTRAFERIPGRRAECLDAFTYSLAARVLINIDLDRRESELSSAAAPKQEKTVFRSSFLNR